MTTKTSQGGRLKEGRLKQNKTPEQCAEAVGASTSTWLKWEYGQSEPRSTTLLKKACEVAGITPSYLVSGNKCDADLTDKEIELLNNWRRLPSDGQEAVSAILKLMTAKRKAD